MRLPLFLTVYILAACLPIAAQPTISEFLAENSSGITDQDGEHSDWIEIHNPSTDPANLAGWSLTDDPEEPGQWIFPDITLPANGYLIVFASGKDRRNPEEELHANFSLSSDGEYLALIAPGGNDAVKEFNFPGQYEDVSYGSSITTTNKIIVADRAPAKWLVPTAPVDEWTAAEFDDTSWADGATGFGYDLNADYDPYISASGNVQAQMSNINGSLYLRIPFDISDPETIASMQLSMRFDDGFIAWINGQQVASSRAPENPAWNSDALNFHADTLAVIREQFNASAGIPSLVAGENILAIQGMNWGVDSSDFLILPELQAAIADPDAPGSQGYLLQPTPGTLNGESVAGFVKDTKFSVKRGHYDSEVTVAISTETEDASIRYTTDGSAPGESTGTLYTGPISLNATTILRAIAFKEGFQPTNIDTQTYLYASDIKNQADMDRDIVNDPAYAATIEDDLSGNLPVISLVLDEALFFGPNGTHTNYERSGRGAEIPVSVEFFNPVDPADEFQIDAGIRIHGGNARSHPKKPFRLYFRGEYGDNRLRHPLFEGSPVESFDQLVLRGGGHDSWSLAATFGRDQQEDLPPHGTLMRDQFLRKTEVQMGILSPRGRYTHLYINGRYWGIYDLHERANAAFFESHLGGSEEDYDVLHHPTFFGEDYTVVDGNQTAWEEARAIISGGVNSLSQYEAIQEYIDLDDYIDHLIVRMWSADYDWVGPIFRGGANVTVFDNKNWYAGRRSRGKPGTFRFFTWDAEMAMGTHLMFNLNPANPPDQGVTDFDLTGANNVGSPVEFYGALLSYPAFQLRFADRLHRHFFNGGIMSVERNRARWDAMWAELRDPMVGESARWGDEGTLLSSPFTRNETWLNEVFWIRNTFIPGRTATVLEQFRSRGLYPATEAPVFSQHGGSVDDAFTLSMTADDTQIYYTLDGSDPYLPPTLESLILVDEAAPAEALIPSAANGGNLLADTWTDTAEPENADQWTNGQTGIGYETSGTNYRPLINLDVAAMSGVNPSVFVRIPFTVAEEVDLSEFNKLILSMKYDDGFVAYLNGTRVAGSTNAPANPAWNSSASSIHADTQAVIFKDFDISEFSNLLREGSNMLAIQALNSSSTSSDLLCLPRLSATKAIEGGGASPGAFRYTDAFPLDQSGKVRARAFSPQRNEWSALTEATFLVGQLATAENLVVSEFSYRPRPPSGQAELAAAASRTDFEFIELQNISNSSIDLAGTRFSQGIDFEFALDSPVRTLAPGESVLIVENTEAMVARYGNRIRERIAGEFDSDSKLSNNGESITLIAANGEVIKSFVYTDESPWPESADGDGFSLVLIAPESNPDHSLPESWQSSEQVDGSPGGIIRTRGYASWITENFDPTLPNFESISAPGADPDSDSIINSMEYAFGTDPNDTEGRPDIEALVVSDGENDYLAIRFAARTGANDLEITGEISNDLVTWQTNTISFGNPVPLEGDRQRITLRSTEPIPASATQQVRLRVVISQ
ncbi:MAG: lamin tail domain-containing protein [Verrucomicrobiota bacterium]|nr:lamin tail domain-containing protein [Verrucomicrobiota bacterium]